MKKLIIPRRVFISLVMITLLVLSTTITYAQSGPPIVNLWGVTCQDINDDSGNRLVDSLLMSLSHLRCDVTTRIVYHPDESSPYTANPGDYDSITHKVKTVSHIMGELLDSYYWSAESGYEFTKQRYLNRLNGFLDNTTLINNVDIWEIGNETNGTWVYEGKTSQVMEYLDTLYKQARFRLSNGDDKKTALTLYFYPSLACVEDEEPSEDAENYMMLKWATDFVNNYPSVINNIDYVLISYYHGNFVDIDTTSTEGWFWRLQIDSLTRLFPNSLIGFGEIGWNEDLGEPSVSEKVNIVNTYYPYRPPNMRKYYPWTHAGFYWNYQEDCLMSPSNYNYRSTAVWRAIDSIMGECATNKLNNLKPNNEQTVINKDKFDYSLSNNYPNPFNPTTRINFSLAVQGYVTLKIYDILGKEVKTLISEIKSPGKFSVDFNASNLPSGIYFYKLETSGFSDIKKMILVK